jgi:hypothetical protein
LQWFNFLS